MAAKELRDIQHVYRFSEVKQNSCDILPLPNHTTEIYFILKGISDVPDLQVLIFLLVLLIYLTTLGGNMTILLLISLDPQLHTPMYFFLGNLSIMDMSSSTVTLHKFLLTFISEDNAISFLGCLIQMYIFSSLTGDELVILTTMSYDRYVAICKPLHYPVVMTRRVCTLLTIVFWSIGFIEMIPHIIILSSYSYSRSGEINHFFCDILPLMKLACNDTSVLELLLFLVGLLHTSFSFFLTFIPYIFIIVAILRIRSSTGRSKAFYTCSSHLTVVVLLYVTIVFQYVRPISTDSLDSKKLFSLFNTAAVPLLNPVIYSLKNKDVKSAIRRRF